MAEQTDEKLQVPMSKAAYDLLLRIAKERGYNSRTAYVRALIAQDIPVLADEFANVKWGEARRLRK